MSNKLKDNTILTSGEHLTKTKDKDMKQNKCQSISNYLYRDRKYLGKKGDLRGQLHFDFEEPVKNEGEE